MKKVYTFTIATVFLLTQHNPAYALHCDQTALTNARNQAVQATKQLMDLYIAHEGQMAIKESVRRCTAKLVATDDLTLKDERSGTCRPQLYEEVTRKCVNYLRAFQSNG